MELATTPLTSGSLTDLMGVEDGLRIQVVGADTIFRRIMGQGPDGLILEGAGYMPSFSRGIADAGFRYTVIGAPGFRGATAPLQDGVFSPVHGTVSGLAAFVAHPDMHRWSGYSENHPQYAYRQRAPGALPSWPGAQWSGARHTGPGPIKARYDIKAAQNAAHEHALGWWLFQRERLRRASKHLAQPAHGTLVLPAQQLTQDWYEGSAFLEQLGQISHRAKGLKWVGLNERMDTRPRQQVAWPGPVLGRVSIHTILPYALPRIALAGHRVSQWLNTDMTHSDAADRKRLLVILNAFVMSQDALGEDTRRAMERIRLCCDLIMSAQLDTVFEDDVMSTFGRVLFHEDDLAHLALM